MLNRSHTFGLLTVLTVIYFVVPHSGQAVGATQEPTSVDASALPPISPHSDHSVGAIQEPASVDASAFPPISQLQQNAFQKLPFIQDSSGNGPNSSMFIGKFQQSSRSLGRGGLDDGSLHMRYQMRQSSRSGTPLTPEIKSHCFRQATCQPFAEHHRPTCFGISLPYKATSFALVGMNDSSFEDIETQLHSWSHLQRVPRCWAVIQSLLCAIFLPRCEGGFVTLPSQELCRATRGPCRLLDKYNLRPHYLSCQDEVLFPADCKQEVKDLKFNTSSGRCHSPLVESEQVGGSFPLVEGCGLQCHHPLVTRDQHKHVHSFIGIAGSICLFFNLFAVLTFLIDWHSSRRYPAVIVCYINFCYLMACIGWLAQFSNDARRDIVCNNDGTLRQAQPNTTETWSCAAVFILIYAFLMSATLWFVVLSYAWHVSFNRTGVGYKARKLLQNKAGYIHVVVWSLAAILTVSIMAMGLVEGNSIYGICFVSYSSWTPRIIFVFIPVLLNLLAGAFFLVKGLMSLLKVKFGSNNVTSEKVRTRINSMILKIGLFMILIFSSVTIVIVCHIYEYMNKEVMEESLQDYVMCLILRPVAEASSPCRARDSPNLLLVYLQLMAMFGSGIAMSSWVWTSATLASWKRFWQRLSGRAKREPMKLKRHKMIAQAFAHRGEYSQVDQMAFSCDFTHDDPVGMNLESNSVASRELSSTWAAMLPKMLLRRGAIVETKKIRLRRHSSTSDLSQCTIHLGPLGSRRHSLDSQGSQQISEQEWLAHVRALARQRKRKTRKERERHFKHHHRGSPWALFSRRSSDTSQQTAPSLAPDPNKNNKVSRATSTGDLPLFTAIPPVVIPVSRPLLPRQPLIPPFTHGMAEASLQFSQVSYMPRHFSPPVLGYTPRMFVPSYAYQAYPAYAILPAIVNPSEPILPLNPMPDSASEAEFIPIILSDSDYTDAGFRSAAEEQQLLDAQRLVQNRIDAITCGHSSACSNSPSRCCASGGKKNVCSSSCVNLQGLGRSTDRVGKAHSNCSPQGRSSKIACEKVNNNLNQFSNMNKQSSGDKDFNVKADSVPSGLETLASVCVVPNKCVNVDDVKCEWAPVNKIDERTTQSENAEIEASELEDILKNDKISGSESQS